MTILNAPDDTEVLIFEMGMRDFDSGFVFTSLAVARDLAERMGG